MRNLKKSLVSAVFVVLLQPLTLNAQNSPSPAESEVSNSIDETSHEAPFVGGVFAREAGEPYVPTSIEPRIKPELLSNEAGETNQLVVRLNLDNTEKIQLITGRLEHFASRGEAEEVVVEAVNTGNANATDFFSGAREAWHLISVDRLEQKGREYLGDENSEEILHQYIVLNYESVEKAKQAMAELRLQQGVLHVEIDLKMELSWSPNDPYFAIDSTSAGYYQWGLHAMRFPQAWDETRGHGYVGAIDGGISPTTHPDLQQNFREQFSFSAYTLPSFFDFHGEHVLGIIGATSNNGIGVAGGCPTCSIAMGEASPDTATTSSVADAIQRFYRRGMQVVNMSFGDNNYTCISFPICDAITSADQRDMLLVAASGNENNTQADFPASHPSVLAVGGAENTNPGVPYSNWDRWLYFDVSTGITHGSSYPGTDGIMAPARSVVSTVPQGEEYYPAPYARCSDLLPVDESGINNDGYGSCTGTSMAAPHISALAGILRSINPRLSRIDIQDIIRDSGSLAASPNAILGHGMANAELAVDTALDMTPNRLTPLFTQFSWGRRDFFFTTVPQMATTATWGELQPANSVGIPYRYYSAGGYTINGYSSYPSAYSEPSVDYSPQSAAWIFTTHINPKSASVPLVPIYRMSWKCGDPTPVPPVICSTVPAHIDTTYTTEAAGIAAFESVGYKLDGIEGYIYPKTLPQPPGTVRLMRKYNPDRDDHAIFPETVQSFFTSLGYIQDSGSDWLGYVYPNSTGNVPVIQ